MKLTLIILGVLFGEVAIAAFLAKFLRAGRGPLDAECMPESARELQFSSVYLTGFAEVGDGLAAVDHEINSPEPQSSTTVARGKASSLTTWWTETYATGIPRGWRKLTSRIMAKDTVGKHAAA